MFFSEDIEYLDSYKLVLCEIVVAYLPRDVVLLCSARALLHRRPSCFLLGLDLVLALAQVHVVYGIFTQEPTPSRALPEELLGSQEPYIEVLCLVI